MDAVISDVIPSSDTQSCVRSLASIVQEHVSGRDCILLDWPDYSNIGDHLIWLGARQILNDAGVRVVYSSSYHDCDYGEIERHPGAPILLTGGGNFGDLYPHHQVFRETIIQKFPERKILILPQTIHYEDAALFATARPILARAKALTILVRDHRSLAFLRSAAPELDVRLAIDAAFALESLLRHAVAKMEFGQKRPAFVLRRDGERKAKRHSPKTALKIDWCDEIAMKRYQVANVDKALETSNLKSLVTDWRDRRSAEYVLQGLELLGSAPFVVTDRLHCHILCRMLAREHILFDNAYGKNMQFVQAFGQGQAASAWPKLRLARFWLTSPFTSRDARP